MSEHSEQPFFREATERSIKRRLKASKWLQRGFLAVAIGAGLNFVRIADEVVPENTKTANVESVSNTDDNGLEGLVTTIAALGAVLAAPTEKLLSKRKAEKFVHDYKYVQHGREEYSTGLYKTELIVEDGELKENSYRDFYAEDPYYLGSGFNMITTLAPLTGATGGMLAGVELFHDNADQFVQTTLGVTGGVLVLGAIGLSALETTSLKERMATYQRRLDNIDGGLGFGSQT